jgi:hypothetical protein
VTLGAVPEGAHSVMLCEDEVKRALQLCGGISLLDAKVPWSLFGSRQYCEPS